MKVTFNNKTCTFVTSFSARRRIQGGNKVNVDKAICLCEQRIRRTKRDRIKYAKEAIREMKPEYTSVYVFNDPLFSDFMEVAN